MEKVRAADLRRAARGKLRGKWGTAAAAMFVYSLLMAVCALTSYLYIGLVGALLLGGPLMLGLVQMALNVWHGRRKLRPAPFGRREYGGMIRCSVCGRACARPRLFFPALVRGRVCFSPRLCAAAFVFPRALCAAAVVFPAPCARPLFMPAPEPSAFMPVHAVLALIRGGALLFSKILHPRGGRMGA